MWRKNVPSFYQNILFRDENSQTFLKSFMHKRISFPPFKGCLLWLMNMSNLGGVCWINWITDLWVFVFLFFSTAFLFIIFLGRLRLSIVQLVAFSGILVVYKIPCFSEKKSLWVPSYMAMTTYIIMSFWSDLL